MKITKANKLTEAMLHEAEEDLIIDPQADSVSEIADTVQSSVEVASEGEKTVSDAGAEKVAQEIKDTAAEVDAGAAVVVPKEDSFIIENKLTQALDRSLRSAKKAMRRGEKTGSNILISGLPGSGKTAIVETWAASHGLVLVAMNAADSKVDAAVNGMPLRDMSEKEANSIIYSYSMEKLGALLDPKNAGNCVLFVDEFNRQTNQQLRRTFLSMFNEKRNADGKLDFSKNLLFTVVCINPAVKEDAGATRLNQAEASRFVNTLDKFDSDPESGKAYFTASIGNKLANLGINAQDAIENLYGVELKTKSGNKLAINQNVEKDAQWEEDVEDYIKILDLALTILDSLEFSFDTEEDLHDIYIGAKQLLNQRLLTDALYETNGDAKDFLAWVDGASNLLDKDKEMFHKILDNYYIDLPALKAVYGVDAAAKPQDNNGSGNGASDSSNISSGQVKHEKEDDEDLFGAYNASTQASGARTTSPSDARATILAAFNSF